MVPNVVVKRTRRLSEEANQCFVQGFRLAKSNPHMKNRFLASTRWVDTLVRILEPQLGDTVYDPTCGGDGMLIHSADLLKENGHRVTAARYSGQEMNWS